MKIKAVLAGALCCAAALLSSCSVIESDTEALMSPPRLTEEQSALHDALAEVAGGAYRLVYPKTEDSLSAFIFRDLDGDGAEEAMVFYVAESAENDTRLNILKKTADGWRSAYSVSGANSSVEAVYFANMADEGVTVMIGWGLSGGEKDVSLYRFTGDRLETLYTGAYSDFGIVDLDGDGFDEVVLFGGRGAATGSARMIDERGGKIYESAETEMTAAATSFISVKVGRLTSRVTALFVDSRISDEGYITEVIWLNGNSLQRLTAPVEEESEEESGVQVTDPKNSVTVNEGLSSPPERMTAVLCRDVDGDGLIEIPVQSELPGKSSSGDSEVIPLTQYLGWNGEEFTVEWSGVADVDNGCAFKFPESWLGFVGVERYQVAGEWRFYLHIPDENGALGEDAQELLRIRVTSANDYQDRFEENYFLLNKRGLTTFYAYIPAGAPATYRLTVEDCAALFELTD